MWVVGPDERNGAVVNLLDLTVGGAYRNRSFHPCSTMPHPLGGRPRLQGGSLTATLDLRRRRPSIARCLVQVPRSPANMALAQLASYDPRPRALGMFVVTEAQAAAIRAIFEQSGELSAAVALRRLFPGITDHVQARLWRPNHRRLGAAASASSQAVAPAQA